MWASAFERYRQRRWGALLRLLSLFAVLFASRSAAAHAPMCDEAAASVVAPIPALPNQTGEIRAAPSCPEAEMALVASPAPERTASDSVMEPGKRALATFFAWPRLRGTVLPVPAGDRVGPLSEYRASVYRPPQA